MSSTYYQLQMLSWDPSSKKDRFFRFINLVVLFIAVCFAVIISSINVPVADREKPVVIPERVAEFVLKRKKPEVKKEVVKKQPPPPMRKTLRKKPEVEKVLTKKQKIARKKAEDSGLLALGNELNDLMDTSTISRQVGRKTTSNKAQHQQVAINTSALTSTTTNASGGVDSSRYQNTVGRTLLSESERVALRDTLGAKQKQISQGGESKPRRGEHVRSEEDIVFVMDQNKSKLHTLYRRARRNNPGLQGKIVLEITIAPSGKVISVRVKSSELKDEKLERSLVARIKQFNFGTSNVEAVTVTFPIEFLPS